MDVAVLAQAEERLAKRKQIDPETGCWVYTGHRDADGYGKIWIAGKTCRVHRVSYQLLIGPIPPGLQLDHLCRVRPCFNPAHLEPVTNEENSRRSGLNQRPRTHCPRGDEYTEENTYRDRKGYGSCRTCRKRVSDYYNALATARRAK
jgi:hypothetical protein